MRDWQSERVNARRVIIQITLHYTHMSKFETIHTLQAEIKRLNREIDHRILRGVAYRSEARRHKDLLRQLEGVRRRVMWGRAFSLLSLF